MSEGQQALDLSPQIPWGTEGSREREKNNLKRRKVFDLHVYLDDVEFDVLQKLCEKTKKSQSFVIRLLLTCAELVEAPPMDYKAFTVEMRRIGTNLNQLVAKANSINFIDREECAVTLTEHRKLERRIASYFKSRKGKRIWQ